MPAVKIENNNGTIRMRVQVAGKRYTFTPIPRARYSDKTVMNQARLIAQQIAVDIEAGQFDTTLDSYKQSSRSSCEKEERLVAPTVVEPLSYSYNYDLRELWKKFLEYKASTGIANSTYIKDYETRLKSTMKHLPAVSLEEVITIRDWIIENKPPAQAQRIVLRINECCEWAKNSRLIPDNPFGAVAKIVSRDIGRTLAKNEPDPFTKSERDEIIAVFKENPRHQHYEGMVKFIFYIGCRPSEAVGLLWDCVGEKTIIFRNAYVLSQHTQRLKTQRSRTVAIGDRVHEVLVEQYRRRCSPYVFTARSGREVNWSSFHHNHWNPVLQSLPHIRYRSPYHMRHTFITLMVQSGESLTDIGKHCGNTPRTILDNYAGATRGYVPPEI